MLLSALNTAQTGRFSPVTVAGGDVVLSCQFGLVLVPAFVKVIKVAVSLLSLKASRRVLSGLRTI